MSNTTRLPTIIPPLQSPKSLHLPSNHVSFSNTKSSSSLSDSYSCLRIKHNLSLKAITNLSQQGSTPGLDYSSPVSVDLKPILNECEFDRVIDEAHRVDESVVILWMAKWCRKCIYLKPKLEKLAADYHPRVKFYCIDVNNVPHQLVVRAGVTEALTKHCDKCSGYKPPRAHHCRVCRRCVLKMDHHCSWINNCVGQRNYKAFFLLVFYGTISSLYSTVIIVGCGVQKDWDSFGTTRLKTFYITSAVMISLLTLTLGTLLGWHIYLLTHNMTTIEYYEGTRKVWLAKKSGQIYKHPYDVGAYRNLTMVLGPHVLKWLWPSASSHVKDGTSFPTVRDNL